MSEDSFSDEVYRVGYGYLLNIICCLGVLGNVLVFLVLCKKRGTRAMKTARHYLLMMTVADICVLILAVARYRSYAIFFNDHQLIRHEFCVDPYVQVYVEPLYLIALGSSSYVTVLLTLDRYLAIRFPLFCMKSTVSSTAAYLQTAASVQMIISLTCPLWFSYTVEEFHFLNKTIVAAKRTDFGKNSMYECRFHQFVIPLVWYVIPWCVMAVLNSMLYSEVQRSSLVCKEVTNISTTSKKLSTVVLFIVLAHMACSFPRCMVAVYNMVHTREGHGSSSNGRHCAPEIKSRTYTCITVAANILNVFNSCLNIVIYCGLGSKFRQEMKLYFGGCWRWNRVAPTTCVVVVASLETKMPASNARTVSS